MLNINPKTTDIALLGLGGLSGFFASFIQLYGGFMITFLGFVLVAYTKIKHYQQEAKHKEELHKLLIEFEREENKLKLAILKKQLDDSNNNK